MIKKAKNLLGNSISELRTTLLDYTRISSQVKKKKYSAS